MAHAQSEALGQGHLSHQPPYVIISTLMKKGWEGPTNPTAL